MKYFDTHCHLDMEPLSSNIQGAVERAHKAGVVGMINVGASLRGSERSIEIANSYPNIWASVGLHPHEAETMLDLSGSMEKLEELARQDKVIAIGEIGLDYFDQASGGKERVAEDLREKQLRLFVAQLDLSEQHNLPVIFHVRDAWDDFFEIMKKRKGIRGVVHCFTGDEKIAKGIVDMGLYIGFTGFITFEQTKFDPIRSAVRVTPIDRILAETDAPFLAPEPYRGKPNEPAYVVNVCEKIAELKKINVDDCLEKNYETIHRLFGIGL